MKQWLICLGLSGLFAMDKAPVDYGCYDLRDQTIKAIKWNGAIGKYKDKDMTFYAKTTSSGAIQRLIKRRIKDQKNFAHEFVTPQCVLVAKQPEDQSRAEYYNLKKEYILIPRSSDPDTVK